jgi:hypothetical protein
MRDFLNDYNKCVSENIKLKEKNSRITQKKNVLTEQLKIALGRQTNLPIQPVKA